MAASLSFRVYEMSNNKMKGLLKGLRYISHIFENEKEPEMQIGLPTDVKHVAHIGWDGPSVNSPSWMNEFKASELGGDINDDASIKSEDSSSRRSAKDPELPKSTRRHASTGTFAEEQTRGKSEKSSRSRRSKHSNKDLPESTNSKNASEGGGGGDIPKKSRRKKSRDSADGSLGSSRTSRRERASKSDAGSECGSVSKSNNNDNNDEGSQTSGVNPSEGGQEKEHTGVS